MEEMSCLTTFPLCTVTTFFCDWLTVKPTIAPSKTMMPAMIAIFFAFMSSPSSPARGTLQLIYVTGTTKVPALQAGQKCRAELSGGGLRVDYIGRSRHKPELLQRKIDIHLGFQGFKAVKVLIPGRVV